MIQCATLGIPKGMKTAASIFIAFCLDFFIRNDNMTSEECKTKTVLNNIACKASYKPSKLEGWSVIEHSFVRV